MKTITNPKWPKKKKLVNNSQIFVTPPNALTIRCLRRSNLIRTSVHGETELDAWVRAQAVD